MISKKSLSLDLTVNRLKSAFEKIIFEKKEFYLTLISKLDNLSPLKILNSGYSLVTSESGEVINSVKRVKENEKIKVQLKDGNLICSVKEKIENS